MRFSFWPAPAQPWAEVASLAQHAEQTGWDGIWYADHFMPNAEDTTTPWPEAWTTLAALAACVPRLRIGTLVSGNTYRHPAVLAKMAATLDHISGGRAVLGLGAGWQENEHQQYGIPFYTLAERLARLDEACQVIRALFTQPVANFDGRFYQLDQATLEPKPVQQPLPLLIGGGGEKVTLKITARYADEWNVWGTVDTLRHKMEILDSHCSDVGRNPADIQRSAVALLFMSEDETYLERMRSAGVERPSIIGGVSEVKDIVAEYEAIGVDELIVPDFTLGSGAQKRATMDTFIGEVAGR
ncbi:MAG: TIGR03560 family F420-dependent LLM class oxidoreductase [Gammaproteobacteria bacterium]|nr:MAG: TIGR03560 family F420-dependent LLM class oxidoreductase [Gammaproteobacteria bacterium]TDJ39676.1 MAG: TIGR03560 family F420-dependent LLM class oxidoreductase [Gammaproteobacteria bacterium]